MSEDDIDFAVVAYRDGDAWQVVEASPGHATDLDTLESALRRFAVRASTADDDGDGDDGGVEADLADLTDLLGLVSVDEDFFVLVRIRGAAVRLVLSDADAVAEYGLAAEVAERVGEDDEVGDEVVAVGDLGLLADLGLDAEDLRLLCDDSELYPDEMLGDIAERLGFGAAFEAIVR